MRLQFKYHKNFIKLIKLKKIITKNVAQLISTAVDSRRDNTGSLIESLQIRRLIQDTTVLYILVARLTGRMFPSSGRSSLLMTDLAWFRQAFEKGCLIFEEPETTEEQTKRETINQPENNSVYTRWLTSRLRPRTVLSLQLF